MPSVPRPNFVFIKTRLLLGRLKTALNVPALARRPCQLLQCRLRRGKAQIIRQFLRLLHTATQKKPFRQALFRRKAELTARPVIEPLPFHSIAGAEAMPIIYRKLPTNRVHTLLREADPEPLLRAYRQYIRLPTLFEKKAELAVGTVHLVRQHPVRREAALKSAGQHPLSQPLLGRECHVFGD